MVLYTTFDLYLKLKWWDRTQNKDLEIPVRGESTILDQREASSSPRKVLVSFILIMAAIAPLVAVSTGGSAMNFSWSWTPAKNGTNETHIVCGFTFNTAYWLATEAYNEASSLGVTSESTNTTTSAQGVSSGTAVISATIVAGVLALVFLAALVYVIRRKAATKFPPVKIWEVKKGGEKPVEEELARSWNRGAGLGRSLEGTVIQTEEKRATTPELPCIVCNLEVRKSDEVGWCPYCGNIGHKNHLLEWLHTHNSCPICQKRLTERILREQLQ